MKSDHPSGCHSGDMSTAYTIIIYPRNFGKDFELLSPLQESCTFISTMVYSNPL